jgi:hypothetical protein
MSAVLARLCVLARLRAVQEAIGDRDRVSGIVRLLALVNSGFGFNQQHTVVDGASYLLLSLFGDRGAHACLAAGRRARSSVRAAELPFNIAVEVAGP